jgi:hypothetical protein
MNVLRESGRSGKSPDQFEFRERKDRLERSDFDSIIDR